MKKTIQLLSALLFLGMITGCDSQESTVQQNAYEKSQSEAANQTPGSVEEAIASNPSSEEEAGYNEEAAETENSGISSESDQPAEADDDSGIEAQNQDGGYTPPAMTHKAGWYMRTVVQAILPDGKVYEHKTAGVFGELEDSSDRRDGHDIESYGSAILQIVFINNRVDISKKYFSDYRAFSGNDSKRVWTFLVKNDLNPDLSHADLKISVEKLRDVFRKEGERLFSETVSNDQSKRQALKLVDVDNQKVYSYDELQNTTLNMDGKRERTFRWVLNGTVDSSDMEPPKVIDVIVTGGASAASSAMQTRETGSSKFGLPPE